MKKAKLIFLLSVILLNLFSLTSFKAGAKTENLFDKEFNRKVNILNSYRLSENYFLSTTVSKLMPSFQSSFSSVTVTLTATQGSSSNPSTVRPNYAPRPFTFLATVSIQGGVGIVTLNNTWDYSGNSSCKATLVYVRVVGNVVYFDVNYQFYTDGVNTSSNQGSYSVVVN